MKKVYPISDSSQYADANKLLAYWEQKSGKRTNLCCERLCTNSNIEATIVATKGEDNLYVIPLCKEHRHHHHEIVIGKCFELIEWKKNHNL